MDKYLAQAIAERQARERQAVEPQQEDSQNEGWLGDFVDSVQGSFARMLGSDAEFVGTVGESETAMAAADKLYDWADSMESTLSADALEARQKKFTEDGWKDIDAWVNLAGQGVGSLAAMIATGGPLKGLFTSIGKAGAKAIVKKAAKKDFDDLVARGLSKDEAKREMAQRAEALYGKVGGSFIPGRATGVVGEKLASGAGTLGYGAAGGAMIGGSSAQQTREEFENAPIDQLMAVDGFADTLSQIQQAQPNLTSDEQEQLARFMFGREYAKRNALIGATIGAVTGPVTGKLVSAVGGRELAAGAGKGFLKGAAIEGGTEVAQEVPMQMAANQAAQVFDPNRSIMDNTLEAGVTGFAGGAMAGGPLGAVGGIGVTEEKIQRLEADREKLKALSLRQPKDMLEFALQRAQGNAVDGQERDLLDQANAAAGVSPLFEAPPAEPTAGNPDAVPTGFDESQLNAMPPSVREAVRQAQVNPGGVRPELNVGAPAMDDQSFEGVPVAPPPPAALPAPQRVADNQGNVGTRSDFEGGDRPAANAGRAPVGQPRERSASTVYQIESATDKSFLVRGEPDELRTFLKGGVYSKERGGIVFPNKMRQDVYAAVQAENARLVESRKPTPTEVEPAEPQNLQRPDVTPPPEDPVRVVPVDTTPESALEQDAQVFAGQADAEQQLLQDFDPNDPDSVDTATAEQAGTLAKTTRQEIPGYDAEENAGLFSRSTFGAPDATADPRTGRAALSDGEAVRKVREGIRGHVAREARARAVAEARSYGVTRKADLDAIGDRAEAKASFNDNDVQLGEINDAKTAQALDRVGRLFGKTIRVVRLANDANFFDGVTFGANEIYISESSTKPVFSVVMHEMLHAMRKGGGYRRPGKQYSSPEDYESDLFDELKRVVAPKIKSGAIRKYARDARIEDYDNAYITEEMIADFFGDQGSTPEFWAELQRELDPTTFQRIIDLVKEYVDKALSALGPNPMGSDQYINDLKSLRAAAVKAAAGHIRQQREDGFADPTVSAGEMFKRSASDQRISTRNPTGPKNTEDFIGDNLRVTVEAVKVNSPKAFENATRAVKLYPGFNTKSRNPDKVAREFIEHVKGNLLWVFDQVPPETRNRSRLWYDGANKFATQWADKYGHEPRAVAGVIAALSPQRGWDHNVSLAERVMDSWRDLQDFVAADDKAVMNTLAALYPMRETKPDGSPLATAQANEVKLQRFYFDEIGSGKAFRDLDAFGQAMAHRAYDRTYRDNDTRLTTPEGGWLEDSAGKLTEGGTPVYANAFRVLADQSYENISRLMGVGNKVRSFYNNIIAPDSDLGEVTIDTHAVAAGLLMPLAASDKIVGQNFSPSKASGASPFYAMYAEAYRAAAEERGVLPREMQSITWEAVRGLFDENWKSAKTKKGVADILNTRDIDAAREEILKYANGIDAPRWTHSDRGSTVESGASSYRGELGNGELHGAGNTRPGPARSSGDGDQRGRDVRFSRRGSGGSRRTAGGESATQQPRETGSRSATDAGAPGRLDPLPGAPNVPGIHGPIPGLVDAAERYAKENNITLLRQGEFVEVDENRARRIADAYEQMPHAPNDPRVKEAYDDLIRQTIAQYETLVNSGYSFWFIDIGSEAGQEYAASPFNAMRDIAQNQRMGVFPTDEGFGSDATVDTSGNPLEDTVTEYRWPFGGPDGELRPVTANDLFRAVHDAFGHGLEGAGFRARGEENAWQAHVRLFTGPAVGAITSETRGQNSWLNYGPHGEKNRNAKTEDTEFAPQKTGLMPEWTWTEGLADNMPKFSRRELTNEQRQRFERDLQAGRTGLEGAVRTVDGNPGQVALVHYSLQPIDRTDPARWGQGLSRRVRAEINRIASGAIGRTYFGIEADENPYRRERGLGATRGEFFLDGARLYPLSRDPDDLFDSNDVAGSEKAIQDAGYAGYWVDHPSLGKVAAVFEPLDIGQPNFSRRRPDQTDETSPPQSGLFSGRDQNGWRQAEDGRLIGYRVDNADRGLDGSVSNIFVSREPDYVKTYYGGISDTEEMLEIAFDPSDVVSGGLSDREPEIQVRTGEVVGRVAGDPHFSRRRPGRDLPPSDTAEFTEAVKNAQPEDAPMFKRAYHGTPHRFDKFSLDAIGTGEGAQAYGWGLYFAERRSIAEWYRDTLSEESDATPADGIASQLTYEFPDERLPGRGYEGLGFSDGLVFAERAEQWMRDGLSESEAVDRAGADKIQRKAVELMFAEYTLETLDAPKSAPTLYQVDIPEDHELLDWDAPLSEQPEALRGALGSIVDEYLGSDSTYKPSEVRNRARDAWAGDQVYQAAEILYGSDREASLRLNELGIKGLRYRDNQSRKSLQDPDAPRNYVIWDEDAVTIEAVNDELVQALEQANGAPMFKRSSTPTVADDVFGAHRDASPLGEESTRERVYRNFLDNMSRLRGAQEHLRDLGVDVTDDADGYTAETLYYGKTDKALRDLDKKHVQPLLNQLRMATKAGIPVKAIDDYLIAKHAHERNDKIAEVNSKFPDGGSGMKNAEASRILNLYDGNRKQILERIAARVYAMNEEALQLKVDAGLIDPDAADAIRQTYQNYVPLETVDFDPESGTGIGMGYDVRGQEVKRAMGRVSRPTSPTMVSVMNAQRAIIRANKAEVGRAVYNLAQKESQLDLDEGQTPVFEIVGEEGLNNRRISKRTYDVADAPEGWQEMPNAKVVQRNGREVVEITETVNAPDVQGYQQAFAVKVGGEVKYVKVNDAILASQLKKMGAQELNGFMRGVGAGTRFLSRMYTQFNPSFTIVNAVRDAITAGLNSLGYEDVSTRKTMTGIPKAWKGITDHTFGSGQSEWAKHYEEFLNAGGSTGNLGMDTIRDLTSRLKDEFDIDPDTGEKLTGAKAAKAQAGRVWSRVLDGVSNVNNVAENAARLAFFVEARESGYSTQQAAKMAKELTVNFNKKGEFGQQLNALYIFFNAAMQGNRALYEHMRKNPVAVGKGVATLGALGIVAQVMNMAFGDDEETGEAHLNKISDYENDHSIVFLTNEDGSRVKVPLPYGYNVAYVAARRIADMAFGDGDISDRVTKNLIGIGGSMLESFSPLGGTTSGDRTVSEELVRYAMPTLGQGFVDTSQNRDRFGVPIARRSQYDALNIPESQKYYRGVSEIAKAITQALHEMSGGTETKPGLVEINPEHLDYWAKFILGGVGSTATGLSQLAGDEPSINRAPVIKSVYGGPSEHYAVGRYYDVKSSLDMLSDRLRDRDPDLTREERKAAIAFNNLEKQLRRLRKNRRNLEKLNRDTTDIEQRIEDLQKKVVLTYNQWKG